MTKKIENKTRDPVFTGETMRFTRYKKEDESVIIRGTTEMQSCPICSNELVACVCMDEDDAQSS